MKVLVPVDGSDCSERALRFGAELARRYDGEIDVVHFTDVSGEDTEELVERVEAILDEEGVVADPEVMSDIDLSDVKASNRIGRDVLKLVAERDYDHVVMGHHGGGRLQKVLLGSAAETVVSAGDVPTTVVP